jgi:hypothetical protein
LSEPAVRPVAARLSDFNALAARYLTIGADKKVTLRNKEMIPGKFCFDLGNQAKNQASNHRRLGLHGCQD